MTTPPVVEVEGTAGAASNWKLEGQVGRFSCAIFSHWLRMVVICLWQRYRYEEPMTDHWGLPILDIDLERVMVQTSMVTGLPGRSSVEVPAVEKYGLQIDVDCIMKGCKEDMCIYSRYIPYISLY